MSSSTFNQCLKVGTAAILYVVICSTSLVVPSGKENKDMTVDTDFFLVFPLFAFVDL